MGRDTQQPGRLAALAGRAATLVGPLLTKELLVTSRRGRYYLLRFAYAALLGLFIALVWLGFIESAGAQPAAWRAVHMPEMGKQIISYIICFQFGAAQLVAVVLLSAAISEEIYQRTLVPILTTPIGFGQIVVGKFLGKLLHVLLLLVVSLPLMAMVRVLGGVPWGYLLAGVSITITAAMFAGSIAMLFSVLCRRAYLSMLASVGAAVGLYGLLGLVLLLGSALLSAVAGPAGMNVVLYLNPVAAMVYETAYLNNPAARVPGFYWPIHCLLMIAMTWGVLRICAVLVHRVAVRRAISLGGGAEEAPAPVALSVPPGLPVLLPADDGPGEGGALPAAPGPALLPAGIVLPAPVAGVQAPPPTVAEAAVPPKRRWRPRGWKIKEMSGSPIIWRELRKPLLRDKVVQIVVTCAVLFYLLYTYAILAAWGGLDEPGVQAFFVAMFVVVGLLCTAIDAATTITPEKQARTWPALLSTPVSDWHILLGKAAGVAFRCLPVWLFLLGHLIFFILIGFLHPLVFVHVVLVAASASALLTASGLFFSARCRRTTAAVLLNVGLGLLLWGLLPWMAAMLGAAFGDREIAYDLLAINPVAQAVLSTEGAAAWRASGLEYVWPMNRASWAVTTLYVLATAGAYALAAFLLALRTRRQFRRTAFES